MAGMLPGVECARRRRCNKNKAWSDSAAQGWTRRPALCLYTTSTHENLLTCSTSSLQKSVLAVEAYEDEKLDGFAREAKKRLDERLRSHRNSETTRKLSLVKDDQENSKTILDPSKSYSKRAFIVHSLFEKARN